MTRELNTVYTVDRNVAGWTVSRQVKVEGRVIAPTTLDVPAFVDVGKLPGNVNKEALYDLAWLASKVPPQINAWGKPVRVVDLFCGCGGLSLGVREAAHALGSPVKFAFASDSNATALDIYSRNFDPRRSSSEPIEKHINGELGKPLTPEEQSFCEMVGEVDILVAGPPCQGNSRLNNHTRGNDPRNLLYLRAVRCAEILRPDAVIIENVPGVISDVHGVFQTAVAHLKTLGYSISYGVVEMRKIGVAQTRKRMILLASRSMKGLDVGKIVEQASLPERPIGWAISDLLDKYDPDDVFNSSATHSVTNQARIHYLFKHDLYNLPNDQRPDCHKLKSHTYPDVYGRMYWDRPSPTLTGGFASCGRGRFVHPFRERTLTPHEAARVQYFPDFFNFGNLSRAALARAIGNAVPARAGYVLALPLLASALYGVREDVLSGNLLAMERAKAERGAQMRDALRQEMGDEA